MNKYFFIIALTLGSILTLQAQRDNDSEGRFEDRSERMEQRRDRMKALKIAFITDELELTADESQQFWPIYNAYQDNLQALRNESKPQIKIEEMTDAEAKAQIQRHLELEERKIEYQRQAFKELSPIIGAKRVLVLSMAENKFRRKVIEKAGKRGKEKGRKSKHK